MLKTEQKVILLVEDEIVIAMATALQLRTFGYDVETASSGERAVEIALANGGINLILMDIDLGKGIDGTEAARRILGKRSVPIVFLTSHAEREYVDRVKEITRYGYVIKNSGNFVLQSSIEMAFELFDAHRDSETKMEALERSKETAESYLNIAAEIIIALDTQGNITLLNDSGYQLLGYEKKELLGKNWFEACCSTKTGKVFLEIFRGMVNGDIENAQNFENTILTKSGEEKTVLWHNSIIKNTAGGIVGMLSSGEDITERRRLEEIIRQNEDKLSKVFKAIPEAISIATVDEGKYIEVNEVFLAKTGLRAEEVIGRTSTELNFWIDADSRQRFVEELNAKGFVKNFETKYRLRTGEIRDFIVFSEIIELEGIRCSLNFIYDAAERGGSDKAYTAKETILPFVMDGVPALLAYIDKDLRFVYVNRAQAEWFGRPADDIIGKRIGDILDKEIYGRALPHYMTALGGGEIAFENKSYNKEGMERYLSIRMIPHKKGGEVAGLFASVFDITERKLVEEQVKKLLKEKELLLKEVHHRIKNNMNIMISLLSLQVQSLTDETSISAFNDAISRMQSMESLYNKLYRSENLRELFIEDYVSALVDEIAAMFSLHTIVEIKKTIEDFKIGADMLGPFGIIITEILTNAMKYAFEGRKSGTISITAFKNGTSATFIFEDNGLGLPEKGYYANPSGFGLQLVGMLTEQIGGTLRIERGNGTKFILNFPVEP